MPALTKILIVEDDDDDYEMIYGLFRKQVRYGESMFYVERASSYQSALSLLQGETWNFFIVDYLLMDNDLDKTGMTFIRRAIQRGVEVPAVLISGVEDMRFGPTDLDLIQARKMRFISKYDLTWERLNEVINDIYTRILRILIVEDDDEDYEMLASCLKQVGYIHFELDRACSVVEARRRLSTDTYEVVLVDYYLGTGQASEILNEFDGAGTNALVIMCTGVPSIQFDPDTISRIGRGELTFLHKNNMDRQLLLNIILDRKMRTDWIDYIVAANST